MSAAMKKFARKLNRTAYRSMSPLLRDLLITVGSVPRANRGCMARMLNTRFGHCAPRIGSLAVKCVKEIEAQTAEVA